MKIYTYQGKKNVSGEKIRQMRNMKRMSQSALAAKMQVEGVMLERDSISRIETQISAPLAVTSCDAGERQYQQDRRRRAICGRL